MSECVSSFLPSHMENSVIFSAMFHVHPHLSFNLTFKTVTKQNKLYSKRRKFHSHSCKLYPNVLLQAWNFWLSIFYPISEVIIIICGLEIWGYFSINCVHFFMGLLSTPKSNDKDNKKICNVFLKLWLPLQPHFISNTSKFMNPEISLK